MECKSIYMMRPPRARLLRPLQCWLAGLVLASGACATGDLEPDGGGAVPVADASTSPAPDARVLADAARAPDAASTLPDAADAVPDAAPAVDAAPPPDAPCTPTWIELLTDGSFDSGGSAWTKTGGTIVYASASMPISAHTADYAAWLVGRNNADEQLSQTVTVPADATSLRLRGYACYVTDDTSGADDLLTIRIRTSGGTPLETLASYTNEDVAAVCGWDAFVLYAADAHAGENVQLHLHGTSDGAYVTSYFVDSLRFEALACP